MGVITFSEYSFGTIDPIYTFSDNTVYFDGVITQDGAQPATPVIAANFSYLGPVFFEFENPVESVSLDVGFFDNLGSTRIEFLDASGNILYQEINSTFGVDTFSYSSSIGIAEVRVIDFAFDAAGFSVDTIAFGDAVEAPAAPPITLATTATSFEFDSGELRSGVIAAFSDTLSHDDRTDSFRVSADVGGTLTVTSLLPSIGGSAQTYEFDISAGSHIVGIGDNAVDPGDVFYTVNWSFKPNEDVYDPVAEAEAIAFEVTSAGFTLGEGFFDVLGLFAKSANSAGDAAKAFTALKDAFGVVGAVVDWTGRGAKILQAEDFERELFIQSYDSLLAINFALAAGTTVGAIGLFFGGPSAPLAGAVGGAIGFAGGGLIYTFNLSEDAQEFSGDIWDERIEPVVGGLRQANVVELQAADVFLNATPLSDDQGSIIKLNTDFYFASYPDAAKAVANGDFPSALAHYYAVGVEAGYKPNEETPPLAASDLAINLNEFEARSAVNTAVREFALGSLSGDTLSDAEFELATQLNSQRTLGTELNINSDLSAIANRVAKDWVLNNTSSYIPTAQTNDPSGWALSPPSGLVAAVPEGVEVLAAFSLEADLEDVFSSLTRGVTAANLTLGLDTKSVGVAEFGGLWVLVVTDSILPSDASPQGSDPILLKTSGIDVSEIVAAGRSIADVELGAGADQFIGGDYDDHVTGGANDDRIAGGGGNDTARYSGAFADYSIRLNADSSVVVEDLRLGAPDGTDTLYDVEFLSFSNGTFDSLTLDPVGNAPPVAADDEVLVDEDQLLSGNVLNDNGNGIDSDPDGDALTVSLISGPSEGILILNDDGSFTYEADADVFDLAAPGEVIDQTFTYQIDDGNGEFDQGTVTISVSIQDDGETIIGTNKRDTLSGTDGGEDIIYGNNAKDMIYGLDGADTIYGGNADDMLFGGESADSLFGERGDDQLYGEQGEDFLNGGRGNDVLRGGLDDDTLLGGRGDDVFVLTLGEGTDTILDYGVGEDLIGLVGLTVDDLTIGQSGDDATISSGGEVLAVLTGVDALTIDEADVFNFV